LKNARTCSGTWNDAIIRNSSLPCCAALMTRAETDVGYRALLKDRTREAAEQFDPRREREAWRDLVAELEARE